MSKELQEKLARILREEVAPILQIDGGDVELVGLQDGVLQVRLHGVCSGCPSTIMAVIHGLEHELKQRVPEIDYLEAIP